jgi:hypothetical protein
MDLRCEEGTGVGCADASGHGNHAKLHGVTWIKTDRRWALRFDGEESCAFVPLPSDQLRPGDQATYKPDSLTLEAWVCPTKSLKGWAGVLGFGQSPFLLLQPSGNQFQAQFMCTNQDDQRVVLVSPAVLSAGQWAHLAATVTRDNVMRLYVNGALVDEKPLGGRIKYASWYPALSIGNGAKRGHLFTGDLTGLRWWNRAATEAEIVAAAATAPAK